MAIDEIPDSDEIIKNASSIFFENFSSNPSLCCCAPGRVNLIGEHTDYNDGFVLPMALPMVTVVIGERNYTEECHLITTCSFVDEPKEITISLCSGKVSKNSLMENKPMWANYLKGVMANFKGEVVGFNAVISSSVPVGGGLSSSAALEVAFYSFLESLEDKDPSTIGITEKALACQRAEHEFLGMPCGIMDQFISFMGKKDNTLLLDCRSLEYELVELKDPNIAVLITNTNVRHKLAESQYSNRKKQCEYAAKIIGKDSLRDATLQDLEENKDILGKELYKRALHVVTENKRTLCAAEALKSGKYAEFGNLMKESHASLRDNYEVSCTEVDTVVNAAIEIDGVFGSKITGGGFGGCTVTLLRSNAIEKTTKNILANYENPTFYVCRPGDGARVIKL